MGGEREGEEERIKIKLWRNAREKERNGGGWREGGKRKERKNGIEAVGTFWAWDRRRREGRRKKARKRRKNQFSRRS